jgi:seryl-tRNA synthetase
MNAEHTLLEKSIKRTTITSNVVSVAVSIGTALFIIYGFYFKTNSTLQNHTEEIKDVKTEVYSIKEKINENEVSFGVSNAEMKALQDKVNGIDSKVDKMDEKLDKILLRK